MLARQAIYLLLFGWRIDIFVCFFAGYHSFLPALFSRLTGKSCYIFLGGTDCFNYPSFNYGNFTKFFYGRFTCWSVRNASLLVPVSENLINSESEYYTTDSQIQGIYHWCKNLNVPYKIVPLEYDPGLFNRQNVERAERSFLTVAFGIEGTSFVRKGVDKIVMLAKALPECTFTIIGCDPNSFPVAIPSNLTVMPPVEYKSLHVYYSRHQFYLQLSIAEGFPSAICEAMLCECIPIGSNVAAIPLIIGDQGFLVHHRDDDEIITTVKKALDHADKSRLGQNARLQIINNFGPGIRKEMLDKIFN